MEIPVNPSQLIDLLRAWFFAKDRSIVLASDTFAEFPEIAIPGNPATNRHRFYYKSTGLYELLSDGTELAISENLKNWTPTVTQSGAVAVTVTEAKWKYDRDLVYLQAYLDVTGSGSAGNAIIIGNLPVNPAFVDDVPAMGVGVIKNAGTAYYVGNIFTNGVGQLSIVVSGNLAAVGAAPSFALASGDIISFTGWYRWR